MLLIIPDYTGETLAHNHSKYILVYLLDEMHLFSHKKKTLS